MKWIIYILFLPVFMIFLLSSCSPKPPIKEIADARLAIISALNGKAGIYAPSKLLKSELYLKLAVIRNKDQKYKESLLAAKMASTLARQALNVSKTQGTAFVSNAQSETAPQKISSSETGAIATAGSKKSKANAETGTAGGNKISKTKLKIKAGNGKGVSTNTGTKSETINRAASTEAARMPAASNTRAKTLENSGENPNNAELPIITEQIKYNKIITEYLNDKRVDIVSRFAEFMKKYPESKFVPNALYWSGEAFYDKLNYSKALGYFKQVITKYPTSYKAPAAQLKIGYSYNEMGMYDRALIELRKVEQEYPQSDVVPKAFSMISEIEQALQK